MRLHLSTKRRNNLRSRSDALPQTSLAFLAIILILALWYSASNEISAPHSILTFSSLREDIGFGNLCTSDNVFSNKTSLLFLIPAVLYMFIGLAIVTDSYFVAALERICERLKLTEDVAGATFMAAGSSTPEFFASMLGVFFTEDEVGVGTIVGSAVFNILVIIGLSAALAGAVLALDWRPLARDSFFYVMSITLLLIFILGPSKGEIEWWEGLILIFGYVAYVLFMAFGNERYMKWAEKFSIGGAEKRVDLESAVPSGDDMFYTTSSSGFSDVSPKYRQGESKLSDLDPKSRFRAAQLAVIATTRLASTTSSEFNMNAQNDEEEPSRTFLGIELPSTTLGWIFFPISFTWELAFKLTIVDCSQEKRAHLWWLTFLLSIVWISGISYVMVQAARIAGCLLNIPSTAMGLTVIAAGTSVPDALASISVARGGAGDMAVSNAIGSNVFDILLGLGVPWFLGALIKKERIPIPVDPIGTVIIPIVILFAIIITLVLLLILLRWKLQPKLGYILFGIYGLFVAYTLLDVYVFKIGVE